MKIITEYWNRQAIKIIIVIALFALMIILYNMKSEPINEYGFYFNTTYKSIVSPESGVKSCVMFEEDGTTTLWFEFDEKYYEENKEEIDKKYNSKNYQTANENYNEKVTTKKHGNKIKSRYEKLIATDPTGSVYFSEDGREIFGDKEKQVMLYKLD